MPRRGRCRCGKVLLFREGPQGYKTRCRHCGAVVRLRTDEDATRVRPPSPLLLQRVGEADRLRQPVGWPPADTGAPGPTPAAEFPVVEMEVWTPPARRARRGRAWAAAVLALLAAGAAVLIGWLTHRATGAS